MVVFSTLAAFLSLVSDLAATPLAPGRYPAVTGGDHGSCSEARNRATSYVIGNVERP